MGSGLLIRKAIKKYGLSNFKKEYIKIFDSLNDMFDMEAELVNEHFIKQKTNYNIAVGGSGGCAYNMKGKVSVKDKKGNTSCVSITDPRYLSGELVPVSKDMIITKDKKGKVHRVYRNDPRYISGELICIFKLSNTTTQGFLGKTHSESTKIKMSKSKKGKYTGKSSSQFGTCWIYHPIENINKKINKKDLNEWTSDGWIKGRKMKI